MKKISVVLPTIGRLEYLDKSIASLLEQTTPFDEFIVFDNSKSQDLRKTSIHGESELIRWVSSGKFLNAIESWNTAVASCSNSYVTIFGDDDIALPDFHEQALAVLERSEFGLVPFTLMNSEGVPYITDAGLYHDVDSDEFRYLRLRGTLQFAIPGFIFRKDQFMSVGGFKDTQLPGYVACDDMLWFELSALAGRVAVSDRSSWFYRKHSSSQGFPSSTMDFSKNFSRYVEEMCTRLAFVGVVRDRVFPPDFGTQDYIDRIQISWFRRSFTANLLKNPFHLAILLREISYYVKGEASLRGKIFGIFKAFSDVVTGGPRYLLRRAKG